MKKLILIGTLGLFAAFTSCKKDRTCVCANNYSYVVKNQTKREAKKICEGNVSIGLVSVNGDNGCYLQ